MAASGSMLGRKIVLQQTKLWREQREISPERTVVWSEPHNPKPKRVPVLYYLSRNGKLEHPHFMEVPLSSPHGLFLSDVINRLNVLRGKGMACMYSWSCKRSYKNGFVWHDLSENDMVYPAHGQEYILKGSELPENPFLDTDSPSPRQPPPETQRTGGDDQDHCPREADTRRRNHSCSSIDFDKSTQTDDSHRRRRRSSSEDEIEILTPPSDSSPETLGTLMKSVGRVALRQETAENCSQPHQLQKCSRRSSVLMQLISCGAMPFKDCVAGPGLGLTGQYKTRAARGGGSGGSGRGKVEVKEYFSGSLVEAKKDEFPGLKRSTSYNGDRRPYLEVAEKEIEGLKAKCIPTKAKAQFST